MSRGKYLSLEETQKSGKLKQFAKEHPSKGDEKAFDELFQRRAKPKQKNGKSAEDAT